MLLKIKKEEIRERERKKEEINMQNKNREEILYF